MSIAHGFRNLLEPLRASARLIVFVSVELLSSLLMCLLLCSLAPGGCLPSPEVLCGIGVSRLLKVEKPRTDLSSPVCEVVVLQASATYAPCMPCPKTFGASIVPRSRASRASSTSEFISYYLKAFLMP